MAKADLAKIEQLIQQVAQETGWKHIDTSKEVIVRQQRAKVGTVVTTSWEHPKILVNCDLEIKVFSTGELELAIKATYDSRLSDTLISLMSSAKKLAITAKMINEYIETHIEQEQ